MTFVSPKIVEGRPVITYYRIVLGEAIMGADASRDMFASNSDINGYGNFMLMVTVNGALVKLG